MTTQYCRLVHLGFLLLLPNVNTLRRQFFRLANFTADRSQPTDKSTVILVFKNL